MAVGSGGIYALSAARALIDLEVIPLLPLYLYLSIDTPSASSLPPRSLFHSPEAYFPLPLPFPLPLLFPLPLRD